MLSSIERASARRGWRARGSRPDPRAADPPPASMTRPRVAVRHA